MIELIAGRGRAVFIIFIGVLVILYIAMGIIYFQNGPAQRGLREQIVKLEAVLARPIPGVEKLQEEYNRVNTALIPKELPEVLKKLVGIARESGIDVDSDTQKFTIPPPDAPRIEKVGESSYEVLTFRSVHVEGDYDSVMAFISDLDSGKTLETMVLKNLQITQSEVKYEGEEAARRAEFREVSSAVIEMMAANNITGIPNPKSYDGGIGINDMSSFPDTVSWWTGSPGGKVTDPDGTSYAVGDKAGYRLYGHDIEADSSQTNLVNYITTAQTEYYYTCEADGTVRQFADVAAATEYTGSDEARTELAVTLDVDIYRKPLNSK